MELEQRQDIFDRGGCMIFKACRLHQALSGMIGLRNGVGDEAKREFRKIASRQSGARYLSSADQNPAAPPPLTIFSFQAPVSIMRAAR
jgi:hypothetical protein